MPHQKTRDYKQYGFRGKSDLIEEDIVLKKYRFTESENKNIAEKDIHQRREHIKQRIYYLWKYPDLR